ncbi:Acyl-CoA synthetase (AMP-forming)/AMP-acid ligase II [Cupriavidus sp. YR651]|uniref:class I adenylate-forming enzyme family protein n=1 Tax=Cupriavidus sp. YR651 TaxID=1855315 RepID=UPI000888122B|nr:class I adenylate-forming enzyme family protein [Cupriavidus sp. YR651]SDD89278.1 Acyl-CoA synthetase (AMP-forming)/AMP-acid ligase II [Cupriavidus sp. YR651]
MSSFRPVHLHEIPRYWASRAPDAPCLYEAGAVIRYGELMHRIEGVRDWLAAQGVGVGDRVMVVGENCSEMVSVLFACSLLQAWPVNVNARLSPREVDTIRAHAEPQLTLFTGNVSDVAAAHAARLGAVPAGCTAMSDGVSALRASHATARVSDDEARAVATLIYTSGTTGAPKGVMVPHAGLTQFARISAQSRDLGAGDIAYAALPMSHVFGIATVLMATLYAGAALFLRPRFDADDVFAALASPGVTILQGVPTMFTRIMAVASGRGSASSSLDAQALAPRLRYLYTGGAPLDPTLKRDVEAWFGQPLHHGYGITEYAGSLFLTRQDAPRDDCSAGYIVEGVEIAITDADGLPVPAGERGQIRVRGPGVMRGYYRNPAQTAEALLPGGWLNTGDLGYLDADGALFISGRSKDLIIRSGFNVYPIEVEAVINAFPGVRQSAVVGRRTPDGNEEVVAFIETHGGDPDRPALDAYLRDSLAPYKRPAEIRVIDTIPTTASGKLLKQPLRAMLE